MEGLGGKSSSSMLSASIVDKFKKELKKTGMNLIPELEGKLKKCIAESYSEIQSSSLTEDVGTSARPAASGQLEQATEHPPLVFHLDNSEDPCVVMAMMINGKPEVLKNEVGSQSTPAYAGFNPATKEIIYGTDAKRHFGCNEEWRCIPGLPSFPLAYLKRLRFETKIDSIELKNLGRFDLPRVFFNAYLMRKLKIIAEEAKCKDGGSCQVAILAVPMHVNSAERHRLKETAKFAGFKEVFLTSAEGLAAYYWFHENEAEIEEKNYSKEFVIVDLFGDAMAYKRSFESGVDGKKILVVKAVAGMDVFHQASTEHWDYFRQSFKKELKLAMNNTVLPVIRRKDSTLPTSWLQELGKMSRVEIVKEEAEEFKYFAAKGAALLSGNPGNIGRQVQNMIGSVMMIEIEERKKCVRPDRILPPTSDRMTLHFKHNMGAYQVDQCGIRRREGAEEMIGYLTVNVGRIDMMMLMGSTELEVTHEINWEGIWKVVGVYAKCASEGNKAISWSWIAGLERDDVGFGGKSYEECKALLLKVAPAPLPRQAKVVSRGVPKVGATTTTGTAGASGKSGEKAVVLGSGTAASGDQGGAQKKKQSKSTRGRVICPNDLIVNTGLKKIQLESDWVAPVVKIEHESVEGTGEGGGSGQQLEVRVKVEEDEDIAEKNRENTRKRKMVAKKKILKNPKKK